MKRNFRLHFILIVVLVLSPLAWGLIVFQADPAQAQMLSTNQLLAKMLWGYPNVEQYEFRFGDSAVSDSVIVFPWQARAIQFSASAYCSIKVYGPTYDDSTGTRDFTVGDSTYTVNVTAGVDTTWQRVKAGETHTLPVRCDAIRIGYPSDGLCRVRTFRD